MNIIVPMAGMGKRMRPHTLTVPKPLIPIAGKPIVHRLVEDIAKVCGEKIDEVAFIIGRSFGKAVEDSLLKIAEQVGAKGKIYYQDEPLGVAQAVYCAEPSIRGKVAVAFADTLFKPDFVMDTNEEGIIWVQKVEDPRSFGVVKLDAQGYITDFVEKPEQFVSDLAIIGVYYFREGEKLRDEIKYLLDNNIKDKGEFQITSALENMKKNGTRFKPGKISEWLDCGNKDSTVFTNQKYLGYIADQKLVADSAKINNSVIIPPVYIGEKVMINNSVVGPFASIGNNTVVTDSRLQNSIVQENTSINNANIANSMVGNFVKYQGKPLDLSLGDYNTLA
jgi:glucose-1-phosphate thymidylyltransferase